MEHFLSKLQKKRSTGAPPVERQSCCSSNLPKLLGCPSSAGSLRVQGMTCAQRPKLVVADFLKSQQRSGIKDLQTWESKNALQGNHFFKNKLRKSLETTKRSRLLTEAGSNRNRLSSSILVMCCHVSGLFPLRKNLQSGLAGQADLWGPSAHRSLLKRFVAIHRTSAVAFPNRFTLSSGSRRPLSLASSLCSCSASQVVFGGVRWLTQPSQQQSVQNLESLVYMGSPLPALQATVWTPDRLLQGLVKNVRQSCRWHRLFATRPPRVTELLRQLEKLRHQNDVELMLNCEYCNMTFKIWGKIWQDIKPSWNPRP